MTFLNTMLLFGLAGAAIPIIIHILNRRRATVVDWAAMQFLAESLTSRSRRILIEEILLMALRCALVGLLAMALARPYLTTGRLLVGDASDAQDVVIVLDGSLSMELKAGSRSRFELAADEARGVLDACRPGDAVAVILAGQVPRLVVPSPLTDLDAVRGELAGLAPAGGSMNVQEALSAAMRSLGSGHNPAKRIVVMTDGQRLGWDPGRKTRWEFLANEARGLLPTRPVVIVRTLPAPPDWCNACVSGLELSRAVVGTDRVVTARVTVANTGTGPVHPRQVELRIDGEPLPAAGCEAIAEGASASFSFEHRFKLPGPHVLRARIQCDDDLPGDNEMVRAVNVLQTLPVLVICGERAGQTPAERAYPIRVALAPPPGPDEQASAANLIEPTVTTVMNAAAVGDLSRFRAVVLADVAHLPADAAGRLGEFVAAGGGLLVAPGPAAEGRFYNNWLGPNRRRLLGCRLGAFEAVGSTGQAGGRFVHVAANSVNHAALVTIADWRQGGLSAAQVRRRWTVGLDRPEGATIGAALDNGDPFLLENKVGRGLAMTLSVPLDLAFSDLPCYDCFAPMLQELVCYLSAPSRRPVNLQPGQQIVCDVPGTIRSGDVVTVATPTGRGRAELRRQQGRWVARFADTTSAGLYRVVLPDAALGELATRPAVAGSGPAPAGIPFVVAGHPDESRLDRLNPSEDFQQIDEYIRPRVAATTSELIHAIAGGLPGREIWRWVAIICAILLIGEILATRAITLHRQMHLARPVEFGAEQVDAEAFRARARSMLAEPSQAEEVATR